MKVYQVWDWDSMASSYGAPYIYKTFANKAKAQDCADKLNAAAKRAWMATCSPEGRKNYRDEAHVKEVEVEG